MGAAATQLRGPASNDVCLVESTEPSTRTSVDCMDSVGPGCYGWLAVMAGWLLWLVGYIVAER